MTGFDVIANYYDLINGDQYKPYADFLLRCFDRYSKIEVKQALDLGCGTGGITTLLAEKSYDMVGADISCEMLSIANLKNKSQKDIRYICQDMRELDLYGTVQAAYSSFDCLNYLKNNTELDGVFFLLRNYIEKGGTFIFDVNTKYRYEKIFSNNNFVYEFGNDMLIWQNSFSKQSCRFDITLFSEKNGGYFRADEQQKQRYFPIGTIKRLLYKNKFAVSDVFGSYNFEPLDSNSEKAFFIAVAE